MTIAGLHHIAIKTQDVLRLSAFYREVLGLEERRRNDDDDGLRSIWFALGESLLMIERSEAGGVGPAMFFDDPPGLHLLALRIPDGSKDEWRRKLNDRGYPPVHATQWTLYVQDPDGNRIGLCTL